MPDGRVRVDALITRPGIFEYRDAKFPGGIRRELREKSEVFDPKSLASYEQMPATHDHPPVMLDSNNSRRYMVGSTGERVDRETVDGEEYVRTSVMVADSDTIKDMDSGKLEVSCGYACVVENKSGVHPVYGRYDAKQTQIRGNHLAVGIDRGRAGRTARVRMDSELTPEERNAPTRIQADSPSGHNDRDESAAQPRKANMTLETMQEALTALNAQLKVSEERADKAEKLARTESHRADVADGKMIPLLKELEETKAQVLRTDTAVESAAIKELKERCDKAEGLVSRFDAEIDARIKSRSSLLATAGAILGPKVRIDDLNERQIHVAVINRLDSSADTGANMAPGVIEGQFISLVAGHNRTARSIANVSEQLAAGHNRTDNAEVETPREKQTTQLRDMWRQPLPNDIRATGTRKD